MKSVITLTFLSFCLTLGSSKVCPDGQSQCPDSATCCELPDKKYGCCPLQNAVCCDDHIHCCPEGSRCESSGCFKLSFNENLNVSKIQTKRTVCPGSSYTCPDESTCCKNPDSEIYNCCLLPNAECCADGESCCPQFSTCDLKSKSCIQKGYYLKAYDTLKTNSKLNNKFTRPFLSQRSDRNSIATKLNSIICPGGSYQCADGQTCCELPDGRWGCCPFVDAVCCADHQHCCPQDMKCDQISQSCIQDRKNITWHETVPSVKILF